MALLTRKHLSALRRRTLLQAGGISAVGLTLDALVASGGQAARGAVSSAATSAGKARSCILLHMTGGPAQQETFDMKPLAPEAPRGEFRPIATDVPGLDICQHMPHTARTCGRLAIVRSVYHDHTFHGAGTHWNLTGHPHAPREPQPEYYRDRRDWPNVGSVLAQLLGPRGTLPAAVHLPYWIQQGAAGEFTGQDAGFLGPAYDPLPMFYEAKETLPGVLPEAYRCPDWMPQARFAERLKLLEEIERGPLPGVARRAGLERNGSSLLSAAEGRYADRRAAAAEVLADPRAWRAFVIEDEAPATVERYGPTKFGRSCLVARRLVEAGVRLALVNWPGHECHFDTHADHFRSMRDDLLSPADRAFAALLTDLEERGLLEETLVVWTAEFGRTPALNGNQPAGRDHWPFVYSVALAGGGIRGGQVYGSSDDIAARPRDNPVHARDIVATIYHALGVDESAQVFDTLGRPRFVINGQPVLDLF
jgi:hypothetical protein